VDMDRFFLLLWNTCSRGLKYLEVMLITQLKGRVHKSVELNSQSTETPPLHALKLDWLALFMFVTDSQSQDNRGFFELGH